MLWYFNLFSQKSWSSKTNNCSFCNKTTQDFAEFWEIWVNFKAKTKTEDEGILRKGKRSSSWFFSLHIGLAGREENQIFCYAKHANGLCSKSSLSVRWSGSTHSRIEFSKPNERIKTRISIPVTPRKSCCKSRESATETSRNTKTIYFIETHLCFSASVTRWWTFEWRGRPHPFFP